MDLLRKHWFDLGGVLAILTITYLALNFGGLSNYQRLMWMSLFSLFLHQLEEYRIVGTFPGMVNKIMFGSDMPDRYPLNTQTALIINVFLGWNLYFLASYYAEKAVWLGMATILISIGNIFAHSILFNIKGKTAYNAGMASCLILFLPISILFFYTIHTQKMVSSFDYVIGIPLGIVLNYFGILKLIDWMKDKDTFFVFPQRCLLPDENE